MKIQRLLIAATLLNLVLLLLVLAQARPVSAQGDPQVLRGRALEIVDPRWVLWERASLDSTMLIHSSVSRARRPGAWITA